MSSGDLWSEGKFCHSVVNLFSRLAVFIQVLGSTLDGNSVNRRLIKLHQPSADIVFKVRNPYSEEKRDLFFFSDPPHLVKTIRNCWQSKHRSLWVSIKFNLALP